MMIYYYSFLVILTMTILLIVTISLMSRRNSLKNRLQELRERRGDYSRVFPLRIQSLKDEIYIIENELAAKCLSK